MNIVLTEIIDSLIVIVLTLVVLLHKWRSNYKIISLSSRLDDNLVLRKLAFPMSLTSDFFVHL